MCSPFLALRSVQNGGAVSEAALMQEAPLPKLGGGGETTAQLAKRVWEQLGLDEDGLADGGTLRPLLMESGLAVGQLGEVWQVADTQSRGSLSFGEFACLCGLIGQAQRGEPVDPSAVDPNAPAAKFA
jgi:hypothetical protein